jgi:hypothetical protein
MKKEYTYLLLLCFFALILRLVIWPFTQIVDADVSSRIFIAQDLSSHFKLIYEGVWLPLHHYLNATMILITKQPVSGPILIHIFLSVATAIPIYFFSKREFNQRGAWIATGLYLTCPIIFRNSFHALSEIPYAFFIACALNSISLSIREKELKNVLFAGLFSTIAAGFRYEAWVLIAVFTLMYFIKKQWKLGLIFGVIAMIFPSYWMIGNQIAHGHLFYGVTGVYNSEIVQQKNTVISSVEYLKRILFFPISWFFFMSPIVLFLLIRIFLMKRKVKHLTTNKLFWLLPFGILLLFFLYKALTGTLLLQHRFSISLIVLSIPFTALLGNYLEWTKSRKTTVILILLTQLPLAYLWMKIPFENIAGNGNNLHQALKEIRVNSLNETEPIPRLENQETLKIQKVISANIHKNQGLILDFTGWENTYFLALESKLQRKKIYIVDVESTTNAYITEINNFIIAHPKGVIQLNCFSAFSSIWKNTGEFLTLNVDSSIILYLHTIGKTATSTIFTYKKVSEIPVNYIPKNAIQCPKENSVAWFIHSIHSDRNWYNSIKASTLRSGELIEEAIKKNAEWMANEISKKK